VAVPDPDAVAVGISDPERIAGRCDAYEAEVEEAVEQGRRFAAAFRRDEAKFWRGRRGPDDEPRR
jgi:hypothetical protein